MQTSMRKLNAFKHEAMNVLKATFSDQYKLNHNRFYVFSRTTVREAIVPLYNLMNQFFSEKSAGTLYTVQSPTLKSLSYL